jgi:general stress protein 26
MDSINKQQPEKNTDHLFGSEGIEKIKELAKKAGSCFFCTAMKSGNAFRTRPMAPEHIDDNGDLWFLSASDSHKNKDIAEDPHVQLLFQGSSYSDFMTLYGTAEISRDKQKIRELWDPMMKTWFTGGEDDPRITVICVRPQQGYYWDTKHSMAVAVVKRAYGAAVGETYDDSIEGKIAPRDTA